MISIGVQPQLTLRTVVPHREPGRLSRPKQFGDVSRGGGGEGGGVVPVIRSLPLPICQVTSYCTSPPCNLLQHHIFLSSTSNPAIR
jgi:hypothetical protein